MKKIFFLIIFLFIYKIVFSQGVKLDVDFSELNKNIKKAKLDDTRSIFKIPDSYNLIKYLPYTHDQGDIGMCVAYSLTTCRTILYARDNNILNKDLISYESFSPNYTYIYNKMKQGDTLSGGMYFKLEEINESGFVKIRDLEFPNFYPFSKSQIFSYPDLNSFVEKKYENKFSNFLELDLSNQKRKKIRIIKNNILDENPAVASFSIWPESLDSRSKFWQLIDVFCSFSSEECENKTKDISGLCKLHKADDWESLMGHAVVVIGYDDNINGGSFLIHNSYGSDWGDNGNMWITYNDFFNYVNYVFICYTDGVMDFKGYLSRNQKNFNNLKVKSTEDFGYYLNFNWIARFPMVNKLGTYSGDYFSNFVEGNGYFESLNSIKYYGRWKDDLPYGNGVLELNNGTTIEANWKGVSLPNVINIRVDEDVFNLGKIIYEGEWNSNLSIPNGKGKVTYLDSIGKFEYYTEGTFNNSFFPNSPYTLFWSNGTKYTGEWENNLMHGYGTYEWPNGTKYVGEFFEDYFHGKGKQFDKNGNLEFEGVWEKDKYLNN